MTSATPANAAAEPTEAEARIRVSIALRTLQAEYEDEGCHTLAGLLESMTKLPAEALVRLHDLIISAETARDAAKELAADLQPA